MANSVATVNGVQIYSNKSVVGVSGNKLMFVDGSWHDGKTGAVHNVGTGYISTEPHDDAEDEKVDLGPLFFDATQLNIDNLSADVVILPTDKDRIEVHITGSKTAVENIETKANDSLLTIRSKRTTRSTGLSVSNIISSGDVVINGSDGSISVTINEPEHTIMTISVPKGTGVRVGGINGSVEIGDTEGVLSALTGKHDMVIGRVSDAILTTEGRGSITVDSVTKTLKTVLTGSGNITIEDGNVTALDVNTTARGDLIFNGTAEKAVIRSSGSGDCSFASVHKSLDIHMSGRGSVTIDGGGVSNLNTTVEGSGDLSFTGLAQVTKIKALDRGSITVGVVHESLDITVSGSGDVTIEDGSVQTFTTSTSGRGSINFDGHATNADLTSSGSGDIQIDSVENKPHITKTGRGDITAGDW